MFTIWPRMTSGAGGGPTTPILDKKSCAATTSSDVSPRRASRPFICWDYRQRPSRAAGTALAVVLQGACAHDTPRERQ